jgi:hypothetical protein
MAEFGWAYVVGTMVKGVSGSVQTAEAGRLSGSNTLVWTEESGSGVLNLTGSINVSGSINANQLNIDVVNKNVINLDASGSTKFGDSTDDTHIFTGSALFSSSQNPIQFRGLGTGSASSSYHYLALDENYNVILTASDGGPGGGGLIDEYTNPGNNRVITSIDSTGINAEQNMLFDGTTLTITGDISSSVGISSSVAQLTSLTASSLTDGTAVLAGGNLTNATTVSATNLGGALTDATQTAVTRVGTLTSLDVSGDLSASALFVSSSNHRVGIGTSAPQKKLEILDPNSQLRLSYSTFIFASASNTYSDIGTNTDGELIITPSGGKVGIGTSSPTRTLDVDGHMRVSGNLEITGTLSAKVSEFVVSADNITFGDSSTDQLTFNAATASMPNDLNFASNLLSLHNAGSKVGIGVQYADNKLEVLDTNAQLKLSYDQTYGTTFAVNSIGNLNITPAGNYVTASSNMFISGGLHVLDSLTSSVGFSGSLGQFDELTASTARVGHLAVGSSTVIITPTTISGATTVTSDDYVGTLTTPAQPNITSVGTLTGLSVSGDVTVDTTTFKIDSTTNRVGIGITDPRKPLEVLHSSAKQLRLSQQKAAGLDPDIYTDFQTNTSGYLLIDPSGGRVGIGTSSPQAMLDVDGHMRVSGNLEISGALRAKVSEFIVSANNITFGDSATDTLIFNAATGTIMNGLNWDSDTWVLDSDNNRIGVGVEHPDTKLHVKTTQNQLKLAYNDSNYAIFSVDSAGDLTISPTATYLSASSGLVVSGATFLGSLSTQHTVVSGELSASMAVSSSSGRFTSLSADSITDGTVTITGGNIGGVGTLTATAIGGTLTTASQPNVTSLGTLTSLNVAGDLTVDTKVLKVDSTTNRIGIGVVDPQKPLEISSSDGGIRLTYSRYVFGQSALTYSDIYTDSNGKLVLTGSGGQTKIMGGMEITGLQSGTGVTTKYLALDSGNNIILTSSTEAGIETRNRRVITGDTTLSADDYYIGISASTNVTITLLDASELINGQSFTIKDEKGSASSHTFRIVASGSQKIDGENKIELESPYGAINLYTDGTNRYFVF